jgi:hypothetical protein
LCEENELGFFSWEPIQALTQSVYLEAVPLAHSHKLTRLYVDTVCVDTARRVWAS